MLVEGDILTNHVVDHALHLAQFFVGDFLEVGEVEAKGVWRNKRTFLLHVVAEHLLQGIVEQVGGGVIGGRSFALVGIHTGHEVSLQVLGQFLHDVDALSVLTLGVDNLDGLVF